MPKNTQGSASASDAFLKAAGKVSGAFKKARTVKADSFEDPDIPNGLYPARVTDVQLGVTKNNDPWFKIAAVIASGEYEGTALSIFHSIVAARESSAEFLCKDLQRAGYETEEMDIADLPGIADHLKENKPLLEIRAKWNDLKDKVTKLPTGEKKLNLYINANLDEKAAKKAEAEAPPKAKARKK